MEYLLDFQIQTSHMNIKIVYFVTFLRWYSILLKNYFKKISNKNVFFQKKFS
jgi:hypothetical protein